MTYLLKKVELTLSRTHGSVRPRAPLICSAASGAAGICTDLRGRCGESIYESSRAEEHPQHATTRRRRGLWPPHYTGLRPWCQRRAAKHAAVRSSETERVGGPQPAVDEPAHAWKPVAGSSSTSASTVTSKASDDQPTRAVLSQRRRRVRERAGGVRRQHEPCSPWRT